MQEISIKQQKDPFWGTFFLRTTLAQLRRGETHNSHNGLQMKPLKHNFCSNFSDLDVNSTGLDVMAVYLKILSFKILLFTKI